MAAQLHFVIADIEYDRWRIHLNEWRNKIANDIEYQKQKQEDLLVLGCFELIKLYAKYHFEKINYLQEEGDFYYSKYEHGLSDDEQNEPYFECYVEENGVEGYFESYSGLFNFVDLEEWIRKMIRSVENEKYCKYVDIYFCFYDNMGNEYRIATIQQEVDEEDIPETEDGSCPCGNCGD